MAKKGRWVEIVFGLLLIVFGVNSFFPFMPVMEFNEAAGSFLGALFATGYIFPIMGILWLLTGLMFLFGKYSALAAVIVFPITLNIVLFHVFLDFTGWYVALIVLILNLWVARNHWDKYRVLCK
jgi:putative oxidoreductase